MLVLRVLYLHIWYGCTVAEVFVDFWKCFREKLKPSDKKEIDNAVEAREVQVTIILSNDNNN